MHFTSETIPAWIVAIFMIYTGVMWLITRKMSIRLDSRVFAHALIMWGLLYGIIFWLFNIDIEVRGFLARLMMIVLCISQGIPLTIAYFRSRSNGDK